MVSKYNKSHSYKIKLYFVQGLSFFHALILFFYTFSVKTELNIIPFANIIISLFCHLIYICDKINNWQNLTILYDGDAASNTLSWKWVAGLQTKGKHYIARPDNIQKFTNGRYNNIKLKTSMPPLTDQKDYFIKDQNFHNFEKNF